MKTLQVTIKGKEPGLLMSRLPAELLKEDGTIRSAETDEDGHQYTAEEKAERLTYRLPGGNLCIPAINLQQCLREGGTPYSIGKKIMENAYVLNDVDLGTSEYEVFSCPARRAGRTGAPYMTFRPLIKNWQGSFKIEVDEVFLPLIDLKKAISTAGVKKGLMSWRPSSPKGKGGRFGRFDLVSFEVIDNE